MAEFDQVPLLEDPQEPRLCCLLLLDTSGSMEDAGIRELNHGLNSLQELIRSDPILRKRVEIAIVTFGTEPEIHLPFTQARDYLVRPLTAQGRTAMGQAIVVGLDLLEERKAHIRANGGLIWRPIVLLMTDGEPTDEDETWREAARRVRSGEAGRHCIFFPIGVTGANLTKLAELGSKAPPVRLDVENFHDFFVWVSSSLRAITDSRIGDKVALPPITSWSHYDG